MQNIYLLYHICDSNDSQSLNEKENSLRWRGLHSGEVTLPFSFRGSNSAIFASILYRDQQFTPAGDLFLFNPTALRTAKTLWSFGCYECNRVKSRTLMIDFQSVLT